jgi:hypothetical protein
MIFTQVIEDPSQFMDLKMVILAIFALAEAAVRITPSEKDNSIVNKIVMLGTYLLDFMIPNRKKEGGRFTVKDNA